MQELFRLQLLKTYFTQVYIIQVPWKKLQNKMTRKEIKGLGKLKTITRMKISATL